MRELYEEKNSTLWHSEIATCHGNTRRPWPTLRSVLGEPATDDNGAHTADDLDAFLRTMSILVMRSQRTTSRTG